MTHFDSLICADWPRGFYLAKELAKQGEVVAYVEQLAYFVKPFGLFLNEYNETEKIFLESFGFLHQQEGGFCVLSPKGVWSLQTKQQMGQIDSSAFVDQVSFKDNFLPFLLQSLFSRVFEHNDSVFSKKPVELSTDYFLFETSLKKKELVMESHKEIHFFTAQEKDISLKKDKIVFKNMDLSAKKFFYLSDRLPQSKEAYLQWQACFFEVEGEDYSKVIPKHFVLVKNLFFPWCYDNFISVFQKEGVWELWMRLKPTADQTEYVKRAEQNIRDFFSGIKIHFIDRPQKKSFYLYGEENLNVKNSFKPSLYVPENVFCADIISELKQEKQILENMKDKKD